MYAFFETCDPIIAGSVAKKDQVYSHFEFDKREISYAIENLNLRGESVQIIMYKSINTDILTFNRKIKH